MENTYKASELIARLQILIEKYGDLPVIADDVDTGWRLEIGIVYKSANKGNGYPERFEIKTAYYGKPEGNIDA